MKAAGKWARGFWLPVSSLAVGGIPVVALLMAGEAQPLDKEPHVFLPEKGVEAGAEQNPAAVALEDQAAEDFDGWEEIGGHRIKVDDRLDHLGRLYADPVHHDVELLVPTVGDHIFLLDLDHLHASVLPKNILVWDKMDRPLPDISDAKSIGPIIDDGGYIRVDYQKDIYLVQPIPPILGRIEIQKLMQSLPGYTAASAEYKPDKKAIEAIQKEIRDTDILVFFATWSPASKHWIPQLMKTLEVASNPNLHAKYFGLSKDLQEPRYEVGRYHVTQAPTVVVEREGKELGRIEGKPKESMEKDLEKILGKPPAAS